MSINNDLTQDWCPNGCQHLAGLGECGMCGYEGPGVPENETDYVIEADAEMGKMEERPLRPAVQEHSSGLPVFEIAGNPSPFDQERYESEEPHYRQIDKVAFPSPEKDDDEVDFTPLLEHEDDEEEREHSLDDDPRRW